MSDRKMRVFWLVTILVCIIALWFSLPLFMCRGKHVQLVENQNRVVRAQGYLRGGSMVTLKNKYGAFVKKVYKYSHTPVKKGDVILEYDDFDIRVKIETAKCDIEFLQQQLKEAEINLALVKLNPLPSEYRNADWKILRAKEALDRAGNEYRVFNKLYRSHSVSDLDMRTKKQAFFEANAEYKSLLNDKEIISRGLAANYIALAEQKLKTAQFNLASRQRDLDLLLEDWKYYRIVALRDGEIITNSDTVGAWNAAGTSAAVLHRGKKSLVYAYFKEDDTRFIKENAPARFISQQSGEVIKLQVYEVKRSRSSHEEGSRVLVKFHVRSDAEHLRLESTGIVEVDISGN